jgi:uncharacterized membrane protein
VPAGPARPSNGGEGRREAARLEAFSDGVMAVIITIMAFGIDIPKDATFSSLKDQVPSLLIYALSFAFIGIYWNNHHHLFRATRRVTGSVMWANLHLLFWLSLVPVATKWIGHDGGHHLPASAYGIVAIGAAAAYQILVRMIIAADDDDAPVAAAVGPDLKGNLSVVAYAAGIGLAWVTPWIAYAFYIAVAVMWFVPDRRLSE